MVREGGGLFGSWEVPVIAEPFWAGRGETFVVDVSYVSSVSYVS